MLIDQSGVVPHSTLNDEVFKYSGTPHSQEVFPSRCGVEQHHTRVDVPPGATPLTGRGGETDRAIGSEVGIGGRWMSFERNG